MCYLDVMKYVNVTVKRQCQRNSGPTVDFIQPSHYPVQVTLTPSLLHKIQAFTHNSYISVYFLSFIELERSRPVSSMEEQVSRLVSKVHVKLEALPPNQRLCMSCAPPFLAL